jgi:homoserine O-acetyltransferase
LSGSGVLPELKVAYETWGQLNALKNNAVLLQCGMSASSHACSTSENPTPGWWEDFIGPGKPLDTNLFYVICTNNLGGCYGSTGPSSINPTDGKRYGSRFPRFEVSDQVAAQFLLLDHLGISRLHACVGSSLGGMQSICAAATYPERVGKVVSISGCAKSFPGTIAFRHSQRQAIVSDPNWNGGDYYDGKLPEAGLRLARQIGTITYRSGKEWQQRFSQTRINPDMLPFGIDHDWVIESYLDHQGKKWVNNYDPNSMLWISEAMDGFSMYKEGPDGSMSLAVGLASATMPALIIGVQHDVLFPVWQQKEIADALRVAGNKHVCYYELDSIYGHDTFLLDSVSIGPAVKGHLEQEPFGAQHFWEDMAESAARMVQVLSERSCTTRSMRDVFDALAHGKRTVERTKLQAAMKLLFGNKLSEEQLNLIFMEHIQNVDVTLHEFEVMRESLTKLSEAQAVDHCTYLP